MVNDAPSFVICLKNKGWYKTTHFSCVFKCRFIIESGKKYVMPYLLKERNMLRFMMLPRFHADANNHVLRFCLENRYCGSFNVKSPCYSVGMFILVGFAVVKFLLGVGIYPFFCVLFYECWLALLLYILASLSSFFFCIRVGAIDKCQKWVIFIWNKGTYVLHLCLYHDWFFLNLEKNELPSFCWKEVTWSLFCVNFRYNRVEKGKNLRGAKEKARKRENREEMLSKSLKTKACSPKLKSLPPFSPKRRRTSLKRAIVQWRPSLAAILAQARSDAANLA